MMNQMALKEKKDQKTMNYHSSLKEYKPSSHVEKEKRLQEEAIQKKIPKDKIEQKEKSSIICYEYKKPRHIKAEFPDLEKTRKKFFKKKKKGLMATWKTLTTHV